MLKTHAVKRKRYLGLALAGVASILILSSFFSFYSHRAPNGDIADIKANRPSVPFRYWKNGTNAGFYHAPIASGDVYVSNEGLFYEFSAEKDLAKSQDRKRFSYQKTMAGREKEGWSSAGPGEQKKLVVREFFDSSVSPVGKEKAQAVFSHFLRMDQEQWNSRQSAYNSLSMGNPWPGIELEVRVSRQNIEKLFRVAPGASPGSIVLKLEGFKALEIDSQGELIIDSDLTPLRFTKPVAYQTIGNERVAVPVEYEIRSGNSYGFRLGSYDGGYELVIDPLLAGTFLGGNLDERYAYDDLSGHIYTGHPSLVEDGSGNIFVIGQTRSPNFPTTVGVVDSTYNDGASILKNDVVITKIAPDLSTIVASTYLGGTSEDNAASLLIDSDGYVYVVGFTRSRDFPVTSTGFDITYGGGAADAFIVRLSSDLSELKAATYLGGTGSDFLYGLTSAPGGSLYLVGDTSSSRFPVSPTAYKSVRAGTNDAFVLRISADLSTVETGTYLGGGDYDYGRMIVLNQLGQAVVLGNTTSNDFPTSLSAYQQVHHGETDAFVSILASDLSSLVASTLVGGTDSDNANSLAINSSGKIVIAGATLSGDFPTVVLGYDKSANGGADGFIAQLESDLSALTASSYIGGAKWEDIYEVKLGTDDSVYFGGWTQSANLPVGSQSYDTTLSGASDAFLGQLSANLNSRVSLSYLGGSGSLDTILSLILHSGGDLLTYGVTDSADFPGMTGAQNTLAGGRDMFLAKITTDIISDSDAHHLVVRSALGATSLATAAGGADTVHVEAHDNQGRIVSGYSGAKEVVLTGPGTSPLGSIPTCRDRLGNDIELGQATSLNFVGGVASCELHLFKAESTTLDATIDYLASTGSPGYDLDLTVSASTPSTLGSELSATPAPSQAGGSVTVSLSVFDAYGNSLGAGASGQTVVTSVTGANTAAPVMTYIGGGEYTGSYVSQNAGVDVIIATLNGQYVKRDTDGTSDGIYILQVAALALDHYEVRHYVSGQQNYNSFSGNVDATLTVRVSAKDSLGNTVTGFDADRELIFSGPTSSPLGAVPTCAGISIGEPTLLSFQNGVATCELILYNAETTALDVTDGTLTSNGNALYDLDLLLTTSSSAHYQITGAATQIAGNSQVVTITARDYWGNTISSHIGDRSLVFSGVTASAAGNQPTATNNLGTPIAFGGATTVTFVAGVGTTNIVLYREGGFSIDVTDGTLDSFDEPTWDLDLVVSGVGVADATQSVISTSANPAGTCGPVGISVRLFDAYGNPISSSSQTVVVTVAGVNSGTPAVTNEGNGSFTAQYNPAAGGSDVITATLDGNTIGQDTDGVSSDGTFNETIDGAGPNTVTWEGDVSTDWHVAGNWVGSVLPTSCSDVVIDGVITFQPDLDLASGSTTIRSLTLGPNVSSTLTLTNSTESQILAVLNDVTIGAHGFLTHQVNGTTEVHRLFVDVGGDLDISSGGAIDVTRKGYDYTIGYNGSGPGGGVGDSNKGYGGSHGGGGGGYWASGLDNSAATLYGSIREPSSIGSAGGGGHSLEGGGAMKVRVGGSLTNAGSIKANGYSAGASGGGGAGGSIWLICGSLNNTGTVSANGALWRNILDGSGGGGGGRVAVYYDTLVALGTITAFAGNDGMGWAGEVSGTVFLKETSAANGDLVINAVYGTAFENLTVVYEDIVVDNLFIIDRGGLNLLGSLTVLSPIINVSTWEVTHIAVSSEGRFNAPNFSGFSARVTLERWGAFNGSSSTLTIGDGVDWWDRGLLKTIGDTQPVTKLVVENGGSIMFMNQSPDVATEFDSVTVKDGGDLRAYDSPNYWQDYEVLNMKLGSFTVEANGYVNAPGWESYEVWGYGPGGGDGDGTSGSGGGHGGRGGRDGSLLPGAAYGPIQTPFEFGSEGGNGDQYQGDGGGRIKLVVTGTTTIDGILAVGGRSEGANRGGGAGGSIWIDTNVLAGSGDIDATGGDAVNAGGGGGGRIAVYYNTNNFSGEMAAQGGNSTNSYDGGAGTIFLKSGVATYGELILDNNHNNQAEVTPIETTLTVENLTVRNGSRLSILEPHTVTVLGATLTTTADSSIIINEGATLAAPNLGSFDNLQVFNFGFYEHSSSTLTVNSGVSWYEDGTSPHIGASQGITSLVINGSIWFGNQDAEVDATFTDITINSGGVLGARKIGQDEPLSDRAPPVAAYNFDEGAGANFSDLSGNGHTGTRGNATWSASGKYGSALSFNGTNAYASVPDAADFDLTSAMTLEAWVYPTAGGNWRTVILKERPGDFCYGLYSSSSTGNPASNLVTADTGYHVANSSNALPLNTWTHLATTLSDGTLTVYVNGLFAAEADVGSDIRVSNQPLRIGGNTIWSEYFQGRIDDVRIYDRALSLTELQLDMYTPVASPPPPVTSQPTILNISANNINIAAGGLIDLNGAGYNYTAGQDGAGPAGGEGNGTEGAGGSYGGSGTADGSQTPTAYGNYYGSIRQPIELGSAGGSCPGVCPGGGAVKLVVAGSLIVNGEVRANGLSSNSIGGGGSGGSVWLDAATLSGNGFISANGASSNIHGAGGGGRIAIYSDTNNFSGTVRAYGGTDAGLVRGGAGTVLIVPRSEADLAPGMIPVADPTSGVLIIDNGVTSMSQERTYLGESLTVDGLEVVNSSTLWLISSPVVLTSTGSHFIGTGDASIGINAGAVFRAPLVSEIANLGQFTIFGYVVELAADVRLENTAFYFDGGSAIWEGLENLTIGNGATLTLGALLPTLAFELESLTIENGGLVTHDYNDDVPTSTINIRANSLSIEAGGKIDAWRKGYRTGEGPGLPLGSGGAGYGGVGGAGNTGSSGISYGSMARPLDLGSGGNGNWGGGGAVLLEVAGEISIDGEINADGGEGWVSGGSAGGSILLTAETLSGNGLLSANGGDGAANAGGGAGGRIAVFVFSQTFIPDGGSISVPGFIADPIGGTGLNNGADGTLYFSYADHYEVTGLATQVSGTSQIIDLQIIDNYGLPFYWNFTRPVIFSGPSQANINGTLLSPTWTDRDNNPLNLGQATTLDFTDGAASSSMTLYKVETTSVDVTDGTITSFANPTYDLDVTVTAQEATLELGSDINAVPSVVEVNNSVNVTVTVKDQWGNAKTTGGDTVTLSVAGANPQALVVVDNGNGTYSSSYIPTNSGIDRITGTLNTKAITGDLDGLSDGTFYITVTAGVANHLEITGPASVIAGTGYHITIKAVAASGAIDGGYSGDRQITLSGALAGPLGHAPTCRDIDGQDIPFGSPMTLEFVLGETTCQMRLYRTGATEVDASDGSINSTGNVNWDLNTTVNNLLAEGITGRISATPNPVERNFAVTIYVATFDSYGNALTSGGQAVTLQVTGVNNTTPAVTDLGDGTYSATYTPTNGGQDLITGTLAGLVITADTEGTSDGVFHETVTATITPTHLEVSGASSQVAGSSQTITISARDNAGDTAFTYSGDKTITLSGPLAALSGTVPTCTDRFGADIALGSATTLTFTNGQATCSLKLYRAEVTSVDATDGTLSSAGDPDWDLDVTVSAGAGAGSESILSASPNPAEVGATVTVTLQAKDAYGNVKIAAGDTVTFAVAGANPAGALSVSYIGSGQYQATYAPSSTGADQISSTINIQAVTKDTDGTSDGTYNENIISYHLEVTGSASQTAGTSQVITISKRRQDGAIDTSYSGDHSLTLSGPLAAPDTTVPTCTDKTATDIALGTATTLTFTNGQATCTLKLYRAEVTAVDATDGTYSTAADPTWDLDVTVSAAPGHSSESILSVSPNPQEVGGTVTVIVQAIDTYQNPLATGGDTVTIAVAGANPGASLVVTDLTNGQYQATYTPAATGMDSVTASINGAALTKDTDGTSDGTYNENIVSYHFEVTGSGTQDSGSTQIVTIQLRRNDGTLRASYSGDHALTLSGPLASPDGTAPTCRDKSGVDIALGSATTLAFVGGQATCVLTLYRAETTSVDAGDGTYDSTGNAAWDLDVVVSEETGSASESILSAAPNPGIVGSSVTVTVQAIDTYGNPRTVGGDTVTLAVAGANPSASLSISYIGGGQYQASYIPTATGTDQITGSINSAALTQDADGTSDGTYHEDIISYHFEVTGVGVQEAGTSQVVTLTLKKNDGSTEVNYLGDHAVTLSGPLAAPDGTAPTCSDKNATDINLGSSTTLTFAGGVATCTLKLYRREVTAVDVSDGTYTSAANPSWDLDITVDAAGVDLNESVLDVAPNPVEISNQVTASVTVRDQFQNLRTAGTDTVTLAVAGANPQGSLAVSYQGGGVYSGTYTPTTQGQDAVSGTVNTAAITQDTDGTSDGVYHLDVVAFHLEVTGSGTQVAGSSQIATITVYRNDGSIDNTYVGDHAVTLSGPGVSPDGTTPTCTDKDGVLRNLGTATTLTFVGGQATCTLTLYRSETTSLDATDGSYSSAANGAWDLDIVVSQASGLGAESILSVSPDPQEVGQVVAISVQAVDTYGNLRSSGGDAVTIAVSGANPGVSLPVTDLGTGIYQASYTPTNTGEDQITGSINSGAILKDSDGVSDGTYHEDIISYHLVVTGSATQTAGASQVITITVTRHDGVTLASYAGDHLLTLSGPLAGLDGTVPTCQDKSGVDRQLGTATTLSFAGGVATCTLKLYRAEVTAVDATDGTYSSAANPAWDLDVTVSPAAGDGSESILSASPNPGEVGATITLSVQIRDSYQNPTSSLGELVTLAVNGANSVPVVTMTHSGGALYQGTYSPVNPGQDLITGLVNGSAISQDTDGTSDGTYHEDIVAYHLEVTGSGTQIAGNMQLLTVTARYHDGSVNTAYAGNQLITLSGPQAGLDGTLPTCDDNLDVARALNTPTTLTFSNGVATCELRLYRAEVTSIDATDGTYSSTANPSWDLDVTVSAGAGSGSQSTLSASPNPGEIAHAISLEVIVLDSYRNPTTGGDNIIFALNGANSQSGLNGAHTGGGVYQASYTPTNPGMDLITAMVNSQAVVYDTDGTSDGTYHEAINAFHIEVTGTATQEAGNSQIITLSVRDHSGALNTSYVGDHVMTISGPGGSTSGQTPTCQDQSGVMRPLGTGSTLLFSAGQATCLLTLYHAETVSVDASDGSYSSFSDPSWDLDLVVTGKTGGAIDGTLGASPNPTNRGNLVTVEVEASDEYGNELAPDTVVNAVVSGANNTALVLTKSSLRIYRGSYTATNAGEDLITATVAAQGLTKDSDGVSDGVYHLTVQEDRATKHKIRGKVYWREPAGEPVKGVIVSDGSHTALSNGHGNYELSDVSDGTYTISGLYEGYEVRVEAGLNPVNVSGGDINDIDLVVWREAPLTLYAPWNGFLDNVVINEIFNIGSENLEVTISLYKMSGSQVGRGSETHFKVKPRQQVDVIINDLNGFEEDRYGVLVVNMSHGNYSGQVSYYKLTPTGSFRSSEELGEDFDYAFPNPFVAPVTGTSWVTFNTHQPSHKPEEVGYLVPNWLTIINGENSTPQYFRIRKYDETGKRVAIPDNAGTVSQVCQARKNELRCRVSALGRIDIDGGHVYPGPERVGLIEIVPENASGEYVASLVRYGVNSSPEVYSNRYSFGSQLQARQGQGREQVLAVSTAGGAENWVEIANTLTSSVRAQVEVVGYNGELLYSKNIKLKPHAQVHLNMAEILGKNSSGVFRVSGNQPGSLLAQSASYYLSAEEQVMGVNITQHQDTFGRKLYGTYNRYLNAYNWLKIINLNKNKRTITLLIHRGDQEDVYPLSLPGYGGYDLPLHDTGRFKLDPNTLGMLELQDSLSGGIGAELLRIKPSQENKLDFSMSSRIR